MARQSVSTRYIGPTNTRGARISVRSSSGLRMIVSWDYSLDVEDNHRWAAHAFIVRQGWHAGPRDEGSTWAVGASPDGRGFVFVDTSDPIRYGKRGDGWAADVLGGKGWQPIPKKGA